MGPRPDQFNPRTAGLSLRKHAHDSGDGETIYHCPFCGSGQVIARSDRSVECQFCHAAFTVQIQPMFPAFPQTVNGQPVQVPGMPGQIGQGAPIGGDPAAGDPGFPVDPDEVDDQGGVPGSGAPGAPPPGAGDGDTDDDESASDTESDNGDAPPWAKKKSSLKTSAATCVCGHPHAEHADQRVDSQMPCLKTRLTQSGHEACGCKGYQRKTQSSLRTSTGARLNPDDYVAHVAIKHSSDPRAMAERVRAGR